MTEELVKRWSEMRGLPEQKAELDLRFYIDLYMKKSPAGTEDSNTQLNTIITEVSAHGNQEAHHHNTY